MAGSVLLLATTNAGKREELVELLPFPVTVLTLTDVGIVPAEETGDTFLDNAVAKADHAARLSGLDTLADDSGLIVEALGGAPGIYSARFAGPDASDAANRRKVLELLLEVPQGDRSARFHCAVALSRPNQATETAAGTVDGTIGTAEVGDHGFGYDPIFVLPDGRSMAQLRPEEKNGLSHRARAIAALMPALQAWYDASSMGARR